MNKRDEKTTDMDMELLRRCKAGDQQAYAELVGRIEHPLMNFIVRYVNNAAEAEDIFQETFLRVVRSLRDFRPTASLSTWIFTIARNLCLDHLKYRRRHPATSLDNTRSSNNADNVISFKDALEASVKPADDQAGENEDVVALNEAIARLNPALREAVILRVYLGLPYQEIAEIVGSPAGTLKYRVHEAINALHNNMARKQTDLGGIVDEVS